MALLLRGKVWHYEFMIHGQRYRGSTQERVKSRAKTYESLLIAQINEKGGGPVSRKAPLLRELAVNYLAYIEARMRANQMDFDTVRHYRHGWGMLAMTALAGMRIDHIGTSEAAVVTFPGGAWNARAAQKTLARMLNWAMETGILRAAPRIRRTKALGRSGLITPQMEVMLLEHMARDVAAIFVTMMDSGMRPDEVMRMEWENVLWDRHVIFIPSGKTPAARRYVPMSDRMEQMLRGRRRESDGGWVFPGKTKSGRRITVATKFEQARSKAGIPSSIVLYSARHTFATNLLSDTGDLALVQRVLGHESIATTQKYLHPSTAGVAEIVNQRNRNKGLLLVKRA